MILQKGVFLFFANKQKIQFEKPIKQIYEETEKKLKDNPKDITSLLILSQIQYKYSLEERKAVENLKKVLQIDPLNIDARIDVSTILLLKKNQSLNQVEMLIQECFQLDEDYWRSYYNLALLQLYKKNLLKTKLCLRQSYEKFPSEIQIKGFYAQLLSEYQVDHYLAEKLVSEIIQHDNLDYEVMIRIAYSYGSIENQDMSEKYLLSAIQLNQNSSKANNNLGYFYRYIKKNDELCLKYCQKALEIDQNNECSCYNLSFCYERKGDYQKSMGLLKKCISINKDYQDTYSNLLYQAFDLKQSDQGYYIVIKMIQKFPQKQESLSFFSTFQNYFNEFQEQFKDIIQQDFEQIELIDYRLLNNVKAQGPKEEFITYNGHSQSMNIKYY